MNQNQIEQSIYAKVSQIEELKRQVNALYEQYLTSSGSKYRYEEKEEEWPNTDRRKKPVKRMVGRQYWDEDFIDESNGEIVTIERSKVVKLDGEFQTHYYRI